MTAAMNQRGHGSERDPFLPLCRAVFTELDRTEVVFFFLFFFLIYTQLCMDLIMTIDGRNSVLEDLRTCNRDFSWFSHNGLKRGRVGRH